MYPGGPGRARRRHEQLLRSAPALLGFSDNGAATRFLIIMGVLELGATLMTRWDERDEFAVDHAGRSTRPGVA
jgi:hypothetical protein